MKNSITLALFAVSITVMGALPALADDHLLKDHHHYFGVPGPIAGVGLPFAAIGYGIYWLATRRRRVPTEPKSEI